MQQYMLRQPKATAGSKPLHLAAIDIHAANGVHPASLQSTPYPHYSSSPTSHSCSRSSSFSNNSWKSAQEESPFFTASSCYSSSAILSSPSSIPCPPWLDHFPPHRSSPNAIQPFFTPPTTTLEALLERLSHEDVHQSEAQYYPRQDWYPSQHSAPPHTGLIPTSPAITATATSQPKGEYDANTSVYAADIVLPSCAAPIKTEKYKTELCRSWEEQGQCRYGQ